MIGMSQLAAFATPVSLAKPSRSRRPRGPVSGHGQLQVRGSQLVDMRGRAFVLRGMSLFWSQWMGTFYNADLVRWLCADWKINVIRASLGVHQGGYLANPEVEFGKVETIIAAAIDLDIYVIVDWHAHHPEPEAASAYFRKLSVKYHGIPNLILEPWNEPAGIYGWAKDIRPYHAAVLPHIRAGWPRNLVILGTENYSQGVEAAAEHPVEADNVAYSFHFYAASHRRQMRQRVKRALAARCCLIATEFGTCEADGDGRFDPTETRKWLRFLNRHAIGHVNWAISDKAETCAALRPGADVSGHWLRTDLTPSGRMIRSYMRAAARTWPSEMRSTLAAFWRPTDRAGSPEDASRLGKKFHMRRGQ